MSEVMMVQLFIGSVSLIGPGIGAFLLFRKYKKVCETFMFSEKEFTVFKSRFQVYLAMVTCPFVLGLFEALTLGKEHGAVSYLVVIAGLLACVVNCVSGILQGLVARKSVSAELIANADLFHKGIIKMGLLEMLPTIALVLYVLSENI